MTPTLLQNKAVFITGGTKGIGLGIAEKMASEKMRIALTGRHETNFKSISERLFDLGAEDVLCLSADVRDWEGMQYAVQEINARWGANRCCDCQCRRRAF